MHRIQCTLATLVAATFLSLLVGSSASAQVGFARKDFPAGVTPTGVVAADFNGDGKLDLAVTNRDANTVSILLGNGDGTFGAAASFPTGARPVAIAAADFNGDTRMDLATANEDDNSISILVGNGDGSFQQNVDLPSAGSPVAVLCADFNGDGHADVVAANRNANRVSIWLGSGTGGFGGRSDYVTDLGPVAVVAADLNGDAKLDLATANRASNTVSILLGDGSGGFGPSTHLSAGLDPVSLALGHFDSDDILDLAMANAQSPSETIWTFTILPGNGDGTFGSPRGGAAFEVPPHFILAADLDKDGYEDLALISQGVPTDPDVCRLQNPCVIRPPSFLVFQGGGTEGLLPFPNSVFQLDRPESMAAGDFNSDGRTDLAIADSLGNSVVVLLQAPFLSTFEKLPFSRFQVIGTTSEPLNLPVTNTGSFPTVIESVSLAGADAAEFSVITDTCSGATLGRGEQCMVRVTFTPTTEGLKSATLTFTGNAGNSPLNVVLRGTGVPDAPVLSFSPAATVFPAGIPSVFVILTNSGGRYLRIDELAFTGADASDFSINAADTACGIGLKLFPGEWCEVGMQFSPSAPGTRTAYLQVSTNAADSPHLHPVSGPGVANPPALSFSSAATAFPARLLGQQAHDFVVLKNAGGADLQISGLAITGAHAGNFTMVAAGSDCSVGKVLVPNQACELDLQFTPSASGSRTSELRVTTNAADSPHVHPLSGTGEELTIAPAAGASLSSTIRAGQTARFPLELSAGSAAATLTLLCTHSIPAAVCSPPASLSLSGSGPSAVNVDVITTAPAWLPPTAPQFRAPRLTPVQLLAPLLTVLILSVLWRRLRTEQAGCVRRHSAPAYCALILAGLLWTGCSGGSTAPPSPRPSTPAGTYTVTVSATAGTYTKAVTLTVVVRD